MDLTTNYMADDNSEGFQSNKRRYVRTQVLVCSLEYLTIIRRRRGDYRGIFTEMKSR